ncbi:hypothetical protein A9995_05380 [Erythrobacter sp. QSSC1-22B]|nr:hypothetical protein [Erythrobacter sp. QSSC1-22B]OBX19972.1 hypothetical protein A9995_05380 [Erythrobacter sp. QSSC1-22B]
MYGQSLPELDQRTGHVGHPDRHFAVARENIVGEAHRNPRKRQKRPVATGPEAYGRQAKHQRDQSEQDPLMPSLNAPQDQGSCDNSAKEAPDQRQRDCSHRRTSG